MKKPDRYDKMVDTAVGNVGGVQRFGITNAGAAALLRRQHAAYVKRVKRQLATVTQERDAFKWKYELVRHDQDYQQCCALRHVAERQRDETTAHLEAQRTATYQAVEREHAAKAQLALAQKGQP